jgi:hypothetical protein
LKKLAVKISKYGEMVSVCQENINHFCISEAARRWRDKSCSDFIVTLSKKSWPKEPGFGLPLKGAVLVKAVKVKSV